MPARIAGMKEFRLALRASETAAPAELRKVHATIASEGADFSRSEARSMGGVFARAASSIKGQSTQLEARIAVAPSSATPMANVAFWGALRHTGWYAHINSEEQQHPAWVGTSWDVAVRGEGPYAINDALAEHNEWLMQQYETLVDALSNKAFPIP